MFACRRWLCKNAYGDEELLMPRLLWIRLAVAICVAVYGFNILPTMAAAADREWLILVYVNALNERGLDGSAKEFINQLESEGAGDRVTIVVKYGMLEAGADRELVFPERLTTVLLQKDQDATAITSPIVDASPIQNMAGETSLYIFARKNMLKYPAQKVMLVYFGKGDGWNGIGWDDISREKMEVGALANTLSRIHKATGKRLDLFVSDADCMQTAEVVYELREGADIIIGALEKGPRIGYLYDLVLQDIKAQPAMDAKSLANAIVYYAENLVTSAVRTDKMPGFIALLDPWVDAMIADPAAMKVAAEEAKKSFSFALKDSRDIGELVDRISQSLPEQHPAANAGHALSRYIVKELISACGKKLPDTRTEKNASRPEYNRIRGLSIYMPQLLYNSGIYGRLKFASDSKWTNFLMELLRLSVSATP